MPFNLGAFTQGLGSGMETGFHNQQNAEELKLRKQMIDAQIKHMDAETQLQQHQMQARQNLATYLRQGNPGTPQLETAQAPSNILAQPSNTGIGPVAPNIVPGGDYAAPDEFGARMIEAGLPYETTTKLGAGERMYRGGKEIAHNQYELKPEDKIKNEFNEKKLASEETRSGEANQVRRDVAAGNNATSRNNTQARIASNEGIASQNRQLQRDRLNSVDDNTATRLNIEAQKANDASKPGLFEQWSNRIFGSPIRQGSPEAQQLLQDVHERAQRVRGRTQQPAVAGPGGDWKPFLPGK